MVLQLKQLFDIDGESKAIDCSVSLEELSEYADKSFVAPLVINGNVENRAGIVMLTYTCTAILHHECDRCLTEFNREYSYDFSHTLVRKSHTDNNELVVCGDNTLDLNQLAISDLLLQLPTKILCRNDCKGLCYVCGQNLNEGECNCS